jgi:hypothetical protein
MKRIAVVVGLLSLSATVWADSSRIGTWVQRDGGMTMTAEETGSGVKFTYKVVAPGPMAGTLIVMESQLDGKEVRVVDQGKVIGTSKSELSADDNVRKIDNEFEK